MKKLSTEEPCDGLSECAGDPVAIRHRDKVEGLVNDAACNRTFNPCRLDISMTKHHPRKKLKKHQTNGTPTAAHT